VAGTKNGWPATPQEARASCGTFVPCGKIVTNLKSHITHAKEWSIEDEFEAQSLTQLYSPKATKGLFH
jgi:hypothetical protein